MSALHPSPEGPTSTTLLPGRTMKSESLMTRNKSINCFEERPERDDPNPHPLKKLPPEITWSDDLSFSLDSDHDRKNLIPSDPAFRFKLSITDYIVRVSDIRSPLFPLLAEHFCELCVCDAE